MVSAMILIFDRCPSFSFDFQGGMCTEASMDPRNVEIKSPWPSYFMLTCLGIPRHDDKKYVIMST